MVEAVLGRCLAGLNELKSLINSQNITDTEKALDMFTELIHLNQVVNFHYLWTR